FARAARMKKAPESGASPSQIPAISPQPSNGKYSHNSCQVSPSDHIQAQEFSAVRLHFLEQMFLAYPDGLSISDNEHRVLWANERFSQMFGYAASEIVGQRLENLVVPAERLAESQWVTEALRKGERITLETKRRKKDGALLDVSVSCAPLILDGKESGFY